MKNQEKIDYLVVGSGIAGTHTAYRLQQQNKKVLLLEKESYVGGRMSSIFIDNNFIDFGAKFIINSFRNMVPLAKELNVPMIQMKSTVGSMRKKGKLYHLDGTNKLSIILYKGISLKSKIRLFFGILYIFFKYRKINFYNLEKNLNLDNKSAYDDFRRLAGAEAFDHIFESVFHNVIFHSTKDLSRLVFYAFFSEFIGVKGFNFPEGIGQLCNKMSHDIPKELGVKIKSVRRTSEGVIVKAIKNNEEIQYETKNLVFAIPGNLVLNLLENPLEIEKEFFPKVIYGSTVQILCQGKTDFFSDTNIIYTLPNEDSNFTSFGCKGYNSSLKDNIYFKVALREKTFHSLKKTNDFKEETLKKLIKKEILDLSDLKIIRVQIWESATPKLYPEYLKSVNDFIKKKDINDNIHYCGDYLENPSTEGALTSSIKLLKRLNKI